MNGNENSRQQVLLKQVFAIKTVRLGGFFEALAPVALKTVESSFIFV
jgi:hypothetical protein